MGYCAKWIVHWRIVKIIIDEEIMESIDKNLELYFDNLFTEPCPLAICTGMHLGANFVRYFTSISLWKWENVSNHFSENLSARICLLNHFY